MMGDTMTPRTLIASLAVTYKRSNPAVYLGTVKPNAVAFVAPTCPRGGDDGYRLAGQRFCGPTTGLRLRNQSLFNVYSYEGLSYMYLIAKYLRLR